MNAFSKNKFLIFWHLVLCIVALTVSSIARADIILQEDFNSGAIPTGWTTNGIQGTDTWQINNAPVLGSTSGGYYAVFNDQALGAGVTPTQSDLQTSVFDCSNRTSVFLNYQHFWSEVESTHGYVEISNDGGATWVTLMDYEKGTRGSLAAPQDTTLNITAYAANEATVSIRFRYWDNSLAGRYWYVDDITVYSDPDVGITDLISPDYLGCGSVYGASETVTVEITNHGFFPVSNIPVVVNVSGGTTATLTGTYAGPLAPGATVNYTVPGSVNMSAAATYNFELYTNLLTDEYLSNDTLYDSRQQLNNSFPYLMDFNGTNGGWYATGAAPPLNGNRNFVLGNIPYLNGPQGQGDSWYVETTSTNNGTWIWVQSPIFDFSSLTNPMLFVDVKHQLHNSDYFRVEYSLNGGTTWTGLGSTEPNWYNSNGYWRNSISNPVDEWTKVQKSLCALAGESCVMFRFRGRPFYSEPTYTGHHYFAFDNVEIVDGPDVGIIAYQDPVNVGCSFSANQIVTVDVYNYGCSPLTNVPVTCNVTGPVNTTLTGSVPGPIAPGTSVSYTFPTTINMTTMGTYDFEAYTTLAGDIHLSNDTLETSILVDQLLINSFPYTENFNSGNGFWIASGQSPPLNGNRNFVLGNLPYLNGPQGQGDSYYVETTSTNNGTWIWVESPVFDFTNVTNPTLTMDIKHQLHNSDYFQMQYSLDGGSTWQQLGSGPSPLWYNGTNYWRNSISTPQDAWLTVEQELCELSGEPCVKFRVRGRPYYSEPTYTGHHYFAFDNITIDAGEPDDVRPLEITLADAGDCATFGIETMSVIVENLTCRPLTNVPVDIQVNGGTVFSEIIPGPIPEFGFLTYTFTNTFDLSAVGTHTISVTTNLATDGFPANDNIVEVRYSGAPIATYPYNEDFNTDNGGWVSRTTNDTRLFHLDTLPYLNGQQGQGDSWYVKTSATNQGTWISVESPVFDFSGLVDPQLFIDLKHQLHNSDYFRVEYSLNGGTSWTALGSTEPNWYNTNGYWRNSISNPVDQWTTVQKSLCALAGEPCVKLRFNGRPFYSEPTYAGHHYFAFDNVEIIDGPDVGVVAYIDPVNVGCLFSPIQIVTVDVYNYSCSPISNVPVVCDITGPTTTTLTGTVPGPIPPGSSVSYSFPTTFNMSGIGTYNFNTYTNLPGDIHNPNDALATTIDVNQLLVTSYPYVEDFNSGNAYWIASGDNPPLNGNRNFVLGNLPYLNGPQGQGDSWYVETTSTNNGTWIWLESPVFDFTNLTNPTLTMDVKHQLHNSDYFQVQYSLDGGSSWQQLGSGPDPLWYNGTNYWRNSISTPQDSWLTVEQNLCELSGESCVKFRVRGRPYYSEPTYTGHHYFAIDNFAIDAGQPDDIRPLEITLADAGDCSAFGIETISVVVENLTCRPVTNVPVDIQVNGGAVVSEVIPGPIPAFGYYIYTFTNTFDLSAVGTHTISVTTNLSTDTNPTNDNIVEVRYSDSPIATFPYTQDFNTDNGGWVSRTTIDTRLFHLDTLPYLNGQQGQGDSWYVMTSATNNGTWISVESPIFDFSGLTNPQLYVDIKHQLHNSDYFRVEYSLNGGTNWTALGSNEPNWYNTNGYWRNSISNPVDAWTKVQKSLCALAGEPCVKFRFHGRPFYSEPTYAGHHYFAFDNFEILEGGDVGVTAFVEPVDQGCLYSATQNVTVEVFNYSCQPETNVPISCDVTGALTTTLTGTVPGPIPANGSVTYTFPTTINMTAVGTYDFTSYTQLPTDIKNDNDTSTLTIDVTQITISTFPYTEDFNSGNGSWLPSGGAPPLNGNRNFVLGNIPYLNGPQGQGDSYFVETTTTNNGTWIWVESPVFDLSTLTNPTFEMDIKHQLHNSDYFQVQYSINGGVSWVQLGNGTDPNWYNGTNWWRNSISNPVDEWTKVTIPLCALVGESCVKFRVRGRPYYSEPTYTGYHYFAFDNIRITDTEIDAALTLIDGCYGSQYSMEVTVFNNNKLCTPASDINFIDITYTIDGSTPVTQTFTGLNIPYGQSQTITIPGVTIPSSSSVITAWCTLPNGLVDQITFNDTMTTTAATWQNCNDYCSNATQLGIGSTTISQTSNATTTPGIDPLFPCGSPTLENTVWYFFETDASGGQVELQITNTVCTPSSNGIQVSINEISGAPCDINNYTNVYCANNGNTNDLIWGPLTLPPNTLYYITIDGYAGNDCDFDLTLIGSVTNLPVELTEFNALCNGNETVLSWATASEHNNDYFAVERSTDAQNFEVIETVHGQGTSTQSHQYIVVDDGPRSGIAYYRLKQVDFDGAFEYSDVIAVDCGITEDKIELYPNPSTGNSYLVVHASVAKQGDLTITDNTGKLLFERSLNAQDFNSEIKLDGTHFEPGVYYIKVTTETEQFVEKWIITQN